MDLADALILGGMVIGFIAVSVIADKVGAKHRWIGKK